MTEELSNFLDVLSKDHSASIEKWFEKQDKNELDEYLSHLTEEEKDALFILLIMMFTKSFNRGEEK